MTTTESNQKIRRIRAQIDAAPERYIRMTCVADDCPNRGGAVDDCPAYRSDEEAGSRA